MLPDLLAELDAMPPRKRLLALVQGVLAGNIFDWGAQACVELYHAGTILEIYQKARNDISHRPWRVDHYDAFEATCLAAEESGARANAHGAPLQRFAASAGMLHDCPQSHLHSELAHNVGRAAHCNNMFSTATSVKKQATWLVS